MYVLRSVDLWLRKCVKNVAIILRQRMFSPPPSERRTLHNHTIPKLLHSSVYDLEARISRIDEFSTRNGNLGQDHPGKGTERLRERGAEGEKQCPSRLLLT